jgi:L-ascorbate metabolism protein UlaG (beta-lactamase superfamily)
MSYWQRIPVSTAACWRSLRDSGGPNQPPVLAWLGQAGFLLQAAGRRILLDPYLSDSLEAKYRGTDKPHHRLMATPVTLAQVGDVDFVLCTHRHTDHMDGETLRALAALNPSCLFVVPRAELAHAQALGLPRERLTVLNAGEKINLDVDFEITAVRAAHEELETDAEGQHRFLGYILRCPDTTIYHSGDTVPFAGLAEEVAAHTPSLALLPINGRGKGVAGNFTFREAVATCREAGIPEMVPHHFGMFAFNTVDPVRLAAEAEAVATPVCHLPDLESSLQFTPSTL